jgi:cytochrome P450
MSLVVGSEEGPTPRAEAAFYPPTVEPAVGLLPLYRFIPRFIRNPLRSLPRAVYEEPLVVHTGAPSGLVWVTAPALVERILLHEADDFPKTPLEKRIFEPILGDGILTSQGHSWRWQRRTAAPLFRNQDLVAQVPEIAAVGEERLALWRTGPPVARQIDREMADVTYDVFTHTLLAGAPRADGEILKRSGASSCRG